VYSIAELTSVVIYLPYRTFVSYFLVFSLFLAHADGITWITAGMRVLYRHFMLDFINCLFCCLFDGERSVSAQNFVCNYQRVMCLLRLM